MRINTGVTFEDIALIPAAFSNIRSRQDVTTTETVGSTHFNLPIISSNMTSVFTPELANNLQKLGGKSIIHRFCTIEENLKLLLAAADYGIPWVSVGASLDEMERAEALVDAGAEVLVLDVAMGNSIVTVEQYNRLVDKFPNTDIIVSDFSTADQIMAFTERVSKIPAAFTIGQGVGSACITRKTTGIGIPAVTAIQSCREAGHNIILNGGISNTGDFCKALALGVKAVIMGRMFAQCREGVNQENSNKFAYFNHCEAKKLYSGSASKDSYVAQGKTSHYRAPEGESYYVNVNTNVEELFNTYSGALRSSMSYTNSSNLTEYRKNARFIMISGAGSREAGAYGKNL